MLAVFLIADSSVSHRRLIDSADSVGVKTEPTPTQMHEMLAIVWSLVLLQGAILVLSTIESLVVNATQGFALIAVSALTGTAAALALLSARGLRKRKRWARRLILVAEWFVLTLGSIELVATQFLDAAGPDIVPILTGVVAPVTVLVLLRRTKPPSRSPELTAARGERGARSQVLV